MTATVGLMPGFTPTLLRRAAGGEPDTDGLRDWLPTRLVDRLIDSEASPSELTDAVCPFCGETYVEPRDRCRTCGGLPVVAPEDTSVYETVMAPCGPGCERAGRGSPRE